MNVKTLDLKAQYATIRAEVEEAMTRHSYLESTWMNSKTR
jgi:hypothetical protein